MDDGQGEDEQGGEDGRTQQGEVDVIDVWKEDGRGRRMRGLTVPEVVGRGLDGGGVAGESQEPREIAVELVVDTHREGMKG